MRVHRGFFRCAGLITGVALFACAGTALAAPQGSSLSSRPHPGIYGAVPSAYAEQHAATTSHAHAARAGHRYQRPRPLNKLRVRGRARIAAGGQLLYWGGPVMHTNKTYAIFWGPAGSMTSTYENLITGFFGNVAAADGTLDNVYSISTQYSDGTGAVTYGSAYGASFSDTATPIPNDCNLSYIGTGMTVSGCVTDADLQAEVAHVLSLTGWTPGPGAEFFVFTPKNVGSCMGSSCAYTYYCAYHSNYTDGGGNEVLYANMPHPDTSDPNGINLPGDCDSGQHPNGDWADAAINLVSHEHSETITDPLGNAWFDAAGNEIGDKCAWNFGTSLGSTASGSYNQSIGAGLYYLQQEWSNAVAGCALRTAQAQPSGPAISSFTPTSGVVGRTVTINGSNFTGVSSVKFNGTSASFTFVSSGQLTATVPAAAKSGTISVTTPNGTATSSSSFGVLPTISSFSPSSGPVGSSVTITGTGFAGATSVAFNGRSASFTVLSPTSIRATVPRRATSGLIRVSTSAGSANSATSFTVH